MLRQRCRPRHARRGTNTGQPAPDAGELDPIATSVVVGDVSACAIVAGSVYCWGQENGHHRLTPFRVSGLEPPTTAIAMAIDKTRALVAGEVLCRDSTGTLTKADGLPSGVTAIAVGLGLDCAIAGGRVYYRGRNHLGQLGDGSQTDSATPVLVQGLPAGVVSLAAGESFACALTEGEVYCWGDGSQGQLGDGLPVKAAAATRFNAVPLKVKRLPAGSTAIIAGLLHACTVGDGAMYCWGYNTEGQLGNGTTVARSVPAAVQGLTGVTAISTQSPFLRGSPRSARAPCQTARSWGAPSSVGGTITTASSATAPRCPVEHP